MATSITTKSGFYLPIIGITTYNLQQDNTPPTIDEKSFVNFSDIFDNNIADINYLNSNISYIDGRIINSSPYNDSNMPQELKTAEFWNKRRQGITLPELLKEFESKASL